MTDFGDPCPICGAHWEEFSPGGRLVMYHGPEHKTLHPDPRTEEVEPPRRVGEVAKEEWWTQ